MTPRSDAEIRADVLIHENIDVDYTEYENAAHRIAQDAPDLLARAVVAEAEQDELRAQVERNYEEIERSAAEVERLRGVYEGKIDDLRAEVELLTAENAGLRGRIADEIERRENDMMLVQGESPRPPDYSEGHYTGWRKGLREAARIARGAA
jgi:chromosome segregation ATPase